MNLRYMLDLPDELPRTFSGELIDRLNSLNGQEIEVLNYQEERAMVLIDGEKVQVEPHWLEIIPDETMYDVFIPNMVTKLEMKYYANQKLKDWINGMVTITGDHDNPFPSVKNVKDGRSWVCPRRWLHKSLDKG